VERQYSYIHKVEEKLNKELGEKVITREGEDYLYKYPLFSNWMGLLYTIVFPLLLLVISGTKIVTELRHDWSINLFLDCTFFLLLAISIILYLIMLHFKFKTNELDQKNI
jgi:hypothetical protein